MEFFRRSCAAPFLRAAKLSAGFFLRLETLLASLGARVEGNDCTIPPLV